MKKAEEMRTEYRREDLGNGVRGKYFGDAGVTPKRLRHKPISQ